MAKLKDLKVGDWVHMPGEGTSGSILCAQIAKIEPQERIDLGWPPLELRNIVRINRHEYLLRSEIQVDKLSPEVASVIESLKELY